jgi:hypothetical protein
LTDETKLAARVQAGGLWVSLVHTKAPPEGGVFAMSLPEEVQRQFRCPEAVARDRPDRVITQPLGVPPASGGYVELFAVGSRSRRGRTEITPHFREAPIPQMRLRRLPQR